MDARLNLHGNDVAARFGKYLNSAGAVVTKSALPAATQALVKIRASQINGCSGCTDAHTKDAEHAGESRARLNLIAVINTYNRLNVIVRQPAGDYQPGQWG
jgi:AhpD family alkylhydroperoxidase